MFKVLIKWGEKQKRLSSDIDAETTDGVQH